MEGFFGGFLGSAGLGSPIIEEENQTTEILVCQWSGSFLGSNAPVMVLGAPCGLYVRIGLRAPNSDFGPRNLSMCNFGECF